MQEAQEICHLLPLESLLEELDDWALIERGHDINLRRVRRVAGLTDHGTELLEMPTGIVVMQSFFSSVFSRFGRRRDSGRAAVCWPPIGLCHLLVVGALHPLVRGFI